MKELNKGDRISIPSLSDQDIEIQSNSSATVQHPRGLVLTEEDLKQISLEKATPGVCKNMEEMKKALAFLFGKNR